MQKPENNQPKSAPPPAPARPEKEDRGPDTTLPSLAESIVVLALLLSVGLACWLIYGPLIVQMIKAMAGFYRIFDF